ncbi:MAG: phosphoglycerate kinase [Dehalococcoidia bacterium]|nr:phosphoglycerate kinase [Dehalococcoidia bacterium]
MNKKTVRDIDVEGRRVLLRVDFNVPIDGETGRITDDRRIREALPTIEYLLGQRSRVIIASALGRPMGRVVPGLSLRPVAEKLSQLLGQPVVMAADSVGPEVEETAAALEPGSTLMLENLRFHAAEEANEEAHARQLAALADVFALDAFGSAHREHASTSGISRCLPAVAGFLVEKEMTYLGKAVSDPDHPYAVISGGAKISDKLPMLRTMLDVADRILIGGGMANTFLKAEGFDVQQSLVEGEMVAQASEIMEIAAAARKQLLLPVDVVVADRFDRNASYQTVSVKDVPPGALIVDVGEKTVEVFTRVLRDCRQVVWNGPLGVIEFPQAAHGSHQVAYALSRMNEATTILGGGETAMIAEQLNIGDRFTHVSTGGGASLEILSGATLPAIEALLDRTVTV